MTRACAPEPKQRYANATELQADLNLFLAGRSLRHARNIERRLGRLKTFAAAACAFLLVAAVTVWFSKREERHARARANEANERARIEGENRAKEAALRQRAEAAEDESRSQLYTALLEQARATVLTGELGHRVRALDAVRRAGAISNSAALRGVAVAALALPDLRFEREWPTTRDTTIASFDPMFERIALCRGGGPVEIRSVSDRRLLATLPASTNLSAYVGLWSPDGRFLAVSRDRDSAASRRDAEVWEVASAKQVLPAARHTWGAMSFHPRLPQIMIGQMPASAVIWNVETGQELTRYSLEGRPVVLKFAPDGEHFAALFQSGQRWVVAVHNATDGTAGTRRVFSDRVREFDWHPTGRGIAVPDFSGAVHWMDAQTGETRVLGRHKAAAVRTFFSPDGEYLFSSGWDRQLICWDVKAMRRAFAVGLQSYGVQFRADGKQCAIFTWPEARSQLYTFERATLHREFAEDLGGGGNYTAFSPDGRWLAASGSQRLVVWDLASDGPGVVVNEAASPRLSFAPNGELFANRPGECFRWRVHAGTNGAAPVLERLPMSKPAGFVSLCLVTNGVVFTSTRGSKLVGYDQLTTEPDTWKPTADGLNGASPDERWLGMYRSYSPHLYVYRLPGFERVAKLTNEARSGSFEFSPQGDELAVPTRGGIELWSTTTWQRTRHLPNFNGILYSPDARTFWLSTDWRTAGLHDARTAETLFPLPPNTLPLALSPDGRHLAVSMDQRRVQVWDLAEVRLRLREVGLDWAADQ
jgi:WD40 repeat protein